MRRTATITLHWTILVTLILLVAGGPIPVVAWTFALCGLALCSLALVRGLMNGPGPKLDGVLRIAHPWMSRGMYLALAVVAGATAWRLLGRTWGGPPLSDLYFYLMAASALHAIFHLWRHTALGDGALRRMTPTAVHNLL